MPGFLFYNQSCRIPNFGITIEDIFDKSAGHEEITPVHFCSYVWVIRLFLSKKN